MAIAAKMNYSHEALADLMLANPTATLAELGAHFGRSAPWICQMRASGMFREHLVKRQKEICDPVLAANIEERLDMAANLSLEKLIEKLSKPEAQVSDELVIAAANFGAKAKGMGGFAQKAAIVLPPPPPVDRIERLAQRLENIHRTPMNQEIEDAVPSQTRSAGEPSDASRPHAAALQDGPSQGEVI